MACNCKNTKVKSQPSRTIVKKINSNNLQAVKKTIMRINK